MLTNGNQKLGNSIWNFNLPKHTCARFKNKLCDNYCYASRDNFLNPWVKESMNKNFEESLNKNFATNIVAQIIKEKIKWVRLHSSGDFYNNSYFKKWIGIVNRSPNTRFLAYTRNTQIDLRDLPKNFVIYFSKDFKYEYKGELFPENYTARLFAYITAWDRIPRHMEKHPIEGRFCNSKCYKCKHCFKGSSNIVFVKNLMCKGKRNKIIKKSQLTLFK